MNLNAIYRKHAQIEYFINLSTTIHESDQYKQSEIFKIIWQLQNDIKAISLEIGYKKPIAPLSYEFNMGDDFTLLPIDDSI